MKVFRGSFTKKQKEVTYLGHRIQLEFEERVDLSGFPDTETSQPSPETRGTSPDTPAGEEPLFKPALRSAAISANGNFEFELPPLDRIRAPVRLKLLAPDGAVLHMDNLTLEQLDQPYERAVEPKAPLGIEPHPDRFKGLRSKLTGRVFDEEGCLSAAGLQVTIWARPQEAETFSIVMVACTDQNGYFTSDAPREEFEEAYGQISQVPDHKIPIRLQDNMLPHHIILIVPLSRARITTEGVDSCRCSGSMLDPIDLVSSPGAYSSDVGGGRCVEFTVPNRTLEEFSYYKIIRTTDPEIRGLTITEPATLPTAVVTGIVGAIRKGELIKSMITRQSISASPTSISEQPRTVASVVTRSPLTIGEDIETGIRILEEGGLRLKPSLLEELAADPDLFTPSNLMTAERHSSLTFLQDLSVALSKKAPGREVLTVDNPVDWDETPTFYQATSIAHGHILHFKQVWRADGYSLGDLVYSLPLAPCQKKQIAIIDWERREAAAREEAETAEERLFASISRDRDISEITQAAAAESLRAGSRSDVESWAAGGGLGFGIDGFVIGGGGGGGGSSASSSAWQDSARQVSASSLQQLRDSTIQAASGVRSRRSTVVQTMRQGETMRVQTEVVANHNHCHAMTVQYFEVLRHFLVTQELVDVQECLFVPLLMSRFDSAKSLRWREALLRFLRDRRLRTGFDALERIRLNYEGSDLPTGSFAQGQLQHLDGELQIAFTIARPRDPLDNENFLNYVNENWGFWGILLGGNVGDVYNSFLKNQEAKDRIFREQLAPRVAEAFTAALRISLMDENGVEHPVDLDPTLVSNYREGVPLYVRLNSSGAVPGLRREQIKGIRIRTLHDLPPGSKVVVHTAFFRYRTAHLNHHLFQSARVMNDLSPSDDIFLSTPLDRVELRNPRNEDRELSRRLLKHLNENMEYYHRAIWLSMDPNRRYMLLDGILAPNSVDRSVASVVENRLIGIIGNCMTLPVSPGFNLDPTYRKTEAEELLDVYAPLIPAPPTRISVPTRGVFAEAVNGSCNSCETKDESRFWRWEESPCMDQPTPIEAISTESRRAEPPQLGTAGFPAPIIAMQNAPAAPDPTGLAAALQVLGNPNLFRDITGLTETQRNALAALQSAFGMAQAFGTQAIGQAANLAMQRNMVRDIDKTMRTIQQAKRDGLLNDEQARTLTESAVRSMIGGGTQAAAQPMTTEQVEQLTNTAGTNDASISVSRPGGENVTVNAQREGLELSTKTFIILPSPQNDPDSRAFFPSRNDKTGVIEVLAEIRNAPPGGSHRWTRTDVDAIMIDSQGSLRTTVRGLKSGKHELDFTVRDASGVPVASQKLQLSIPQFVTIDEGGSSSPTPFDDFLAVFQLTTRKDDIIREAKQVCDHLLRTSNARTIWRIGSFGETLPAHLPATNVTTLRIHNEPPPGLEGTPGITHTPAGVAVLNETIDIYPGALDDPSSHWVSTEVSALLLQIESQGMTPALENFAVTLLGRMIGFTMSHEIVHSLLAFEIPTGHNDPAIPGDLMNRGVDLTFTEFCGFEDTARTSPVDPANFIDHGISALASLLSTNQGRIDARFPVPPAFT